MALCTLLEILISRATSSVQWLPYLLQYRSTQFQPATHLLTSFCITSQKLKHYQPCVCTDPSNELQFALAQVTQEFVALCAEIPAAARQVSPLGLCNTTAPVAEHELPTLKQALADMEHANDVLNKAPGAVFAPVSVSWCWPPCPALAGLVHLLSRTSDWELGVVQ